MNHLFVSYSRTDQQWVLALVGALHTAGVDVWLDQRSLPVSLPWLAEVRDAIDEARAVLVCDSPRFRSSSPCASEVELAGNAGKRTISVTVGADIEQSSYEVLAAIRTVPASALAATELRVRARNWDRAGRPRGALVGWRDQRRLQSATRVVTDTETSDGRAFLRASRRRNRRRGALAALVGLVYFVGRGADRILPDLTNHASGIDQKFAERVSQVADIDTVSKTDAYEALRRAVAMEAPESELTTTGLREALVRPVPDDAFSLGGTPREFVGGAIEDLVRVVDEQGTIWARDSKAPDQRAGERWNGTLPDPAATTGLRAEVQLDSGAVEVFDGNRLIRRVFVPTGPLTLAEVSPDQQSVAVSSGGDINIISVSSGQIVRTLSGSGGEVRDLRWVADGGRLWAIAGDRVVSWEITTAETIVLAPDTWNAAIVPSENGSAWLVQRDGRLRLVDLATGEELRTSDVGARVLAVTVAAESFLVASDTANFVVDRATGRVGLVDPITCNSAIGRGAALADGKSVIVPCEDGSVLVIDLDSRRVTRTFEVPLAAVVTVDGERVLAASSDGAVYDIDTSTGAVTLAGIADGCRARFTTIAAQGDIVLAAGVGAGHMFCTLSTTNGGDTWVSWLVYFADPGMARSSLVIGGGSVVVLGMDDGRVAIFPAHNFGAVRFEFVSGGVRDMVFDEASSTLYAVTRNGELARVPLDPAAVTADWMASEAADRLTRAVELGLTTIPA